jgi:hypothetical protein
MVILSKVIHGQADFSIPFGLQGRQHIQAGREAHADRPAL